MIEIRMDFSTEYISEDQKDVYAVFSKLVKEAERMRAKSYAPYSHWTVGAALLSQSGVLYRGCNVENAAYTPTCCAERTAFFQAIAQGERRFRCIAIAGGREGEPSRTFCAPCGVCRQVMAEFCEEDFQIILTDGENMRIYTWKELLPEPFGPKNLEEISYENV